MRRISAAIMGVLILGFAAKAFANIQGSAHDFTATGELAMEAAAQAAAGQVPENPGAIGGLGGVTELCQTCHTPHRPVLNVPLWAHNLSQASYNLYNENTDPAAGPVYTGWEGKQYTSLDSNGSPITVTVNAYDANSLQNSRSRLCLSCHDGTVAVNSFAGMESNGSGDFFMPRDHMVTGNASLNGGFAENTPGVAATQLSLKGSHPVGVDYAKIQQAPEAEFNPPSTIGLKLEGGRVQCTTCHNPHNKFGRMLAVDMQTDYLCTKCHIK